MNMLIIAVIVVAIVFCLACGILLVAWFWMGRKQFQFILYAKDGTNRTYLNAKVKTDPKHPDVQKFVFSGGQSLDIKEPTCYINKKPVREITYNKLGEYCYLTATKFDEKNYNSKALEPEEKQIALFRYKENSERYAKTLDKYQAITLIAMFVMTLIIGIGIIYCTITYVNTTSKFVEIAQENGKVADELKNIANIFQGISQQQSVITAALVGNNTIIRKLD